MVIKVTPPLTVRQLYHLENFQIESSEIMYIYKCQELVPKQTKMLKNILGSNLQIFLENYLYILCLVNKHVSKLKGEINASFQKKLHSMRL
jgi:hypothetical protein